MKKYIGIWIMVFIAFSWFVSAQFANNDGRLYPDPTEWWSYVWQEYEGEKVNVVGWKSLWEYILQLFILLCAVVLCVKLWIARRNKCDKNHIDAIKRKNNKFFSFDDFIKSKLFLICLALLIVYSIGSLLIYLNVSLFYDGEVPFHRVSVLLVIYGFIPKQVIRVFLWVFLFKASSAQHVENTHPFLKKYNFQLLIFMCCVFLWYIILVAYMSIYQDGIVQILLFSGLVETMILLFFLRRSSKYIIEDSNI